MRADKLSGGLFLEKHLACIDPPLPPLTPGPGKLPESVHPQTRHELIN